MYSRKASIEIPAITQKNAISSRQKDCRQVYAKELEGRIGIRYSVLGKLTLLCRLSCNLR